MLSFISIRESRWAKRFSLFLVINFFAEWIAPFAMFALTTGPSQEEFTSFTPFDASNMVDPYTGKLNYNIPLMVVPGPNGGYPINLGYNAGIGMDQEASWVGLGWNLNVGAINRQLRGVPDDFKGEVLKEKKEQRPNRTFIWNLGRTLSKSKELLGFQLKPNKLLKGTKLGKWLKRDLLEINLSYNNYNGASYDLKTGLGNLFGVPQLSLGFGYNSHNGIDTDIGVDFIRNLGISHLGGNDVNVDNLSITKGFRLGVNSRSGFQSLSLNTGVSGDAYNGSSAEKQGISKSGMISFSSGYNFPVTSRAPMVYKTENIDIKIGSANFPFSESPVPIEGTIIEHKVANDGVLNTPTFGYLYTNEATEDSQKDFQKNNYSLSKKIPNLPPSTFTYDLYSLSGEGIAGQFRAHRADIGVLSKPTRKDRFDGGNKNTELGFGGDGVTVSVHLGFSDVKTTGEIKSGVWEKYNNIDLSFEDKVNNRNPFYFKMVGEKNSIAKENHQLYQNWGGEEAFRANIDKEESSGNTHYIVNHQYDERKKTDNNANCTSNSPNVIDINKDGYKKLPEDNFLNTQQIQALTIKEARTLQDPNSGLFQEPFFEVVDRENNGAYIPWSAPEHHIGQFNVTGLDGTTYVYGKPLYNKEQIDVAFSCQPPNETNQFDTEESLKEYRVDAQNEADNETKRKFYSKSEIDPYIHSWLITAVYSADYVDKTGNGPSNDDLGYWVKFNYRQNENHAWRTPLSGAHYDAGAYLDPHDDTGTFTYGSKQISYLESIETKTHIAKFRTSEREDGLSALGELDNDNQGNLDAPYTPYGYNPLENDGETLKNGIKQPRKLEKIDLYLKHDDEETSTPLQTTHFQYSYELCKNVPNNTGIQFSDDFDSEAYINAPNTNRGKLTLKKVWTTFNGSSRGKQTPYQFTYSENNPSYHIRNYDRWGGYKENMDGNQLALGIYPYKQFPYTDQDESPMVNNWCLTEIDTPTGSKLKIEYEADDYAYVENKKAMQMFDIVSIGDPPSVDDFGTGTLEEYRGNTNISTGDIENTEEADNGYKIYFRLPRKISPDAILMSEGGTDTGDIASYVRRHFIDGIKDVYLNVLVNFTGLKLLCSTPPLQEFDYQDFVSFYAKIDVSAECGLEKIGGGEDYNVGYITLKKEKAKFISSINPIQKAAFQHMKINQPRIINDIDMLCASGDFGESVKQFVLDVIGILVDLPDDAASILSGYQSYMKDKNWAESIDLNGRSKIRLHNPEGKKYAGTARVKRVMVEDHNWKNATNDSPETIIYGQEYIYEIEENGRIISSGVAYEPLIGGEENALREPIPYKESESFLHSAFHLFLEKPLMENYYPSAQVGYRNVIVKSINASENIYQATPYTQYEFYSPKDFPIKFKDTGITDPEPITRVSPPIPFFSKSYREIGFSQGYSLILNDMAGKPISVRQLTFPNEASEEADKVAMLRGEGQLIMEEEYEYFTQNRNEVQSEIPILQKGEDDYEYKTGIVGLSYDIFLDADETHSHRRTAGIDMNIDLKFVPPSPFPVPLPAPHPQHNENTEIVRTIVTNKIIYKRGMLKSKTITDQAATITTTNLAFDPLTGEAILTKVDNEFKDDLYSMQYPAYWYYDEGLGLANENIGLQLSGVDLNNLSTDEAAIFVPGDKIWIEDGGTESIVWVTSVNGNNVEYIDESGATPSIGNSVNIKIIKSGRKNMPGVKAGSIAMKKIDDTFEQFIEDFPCGNEGSFSISEDNEVLNASAVTFKDEFPIFCSDATQYVIGDICDAWDEEYYPNLIRDLLNSVQNEVKIPYWKGGGELASQSGLLINCPDTSTEDPNDFTQNPNDFLHTTQGISNSSNPYIEFEYCDCEISINYSPSGDDLPKSELWELLKVGSYSDADGIKYKFLGFTIDLESASVENGQGSFEANISVVKVYPPPFEGADEYLHGITITYDASDNCWVPPCEHTIQGPTDATVQSSDCSPYLTQTINPYKEGLKGKWRVDKTYFWNSNREYATTTNSNNVMQMTENGVREDGILTDFEEFDWNNPSTVSDAKNLSDHWHEATTVTKYSPYGFELEEMNSLGIYSAVLYGYNHSLNTAVGANTTYNEMGFDGFEDYLMQMDVSGVNYGDLYSCQPTQSHFKFIKVDGTNISALDKCDDSNTNFCLSEREAHTGKYSLFLADNGDQVTMTKKVQESNNCNTDSTLDDCDCIGWFSPKQGKKYHVSAWVKESGTPMSSETHTGPTVSIGFGGTSTAIETITLETSIQSPMIEGWQQIMGEFTVPPEAKTISIMLANSKENEGVYFDDIRIHPYNANIKSFVYHPDNLRLVAELDENNFATFYIHDEEGKLIKIKKETERGVKTIQESRYHVPATQ